MLRCLIVILTTLLTGCGFSNLKPQSYAISAFDDNDDNRILANSLMRYGREIYKFRDPGIPDSQLAALEIMSPTLEDGVIYFNYRFNEWRLSWAYESNRFHSALGDSVKGLANVHRENAHSIETAREHMPILVAKMVVQDHEYIAGVASEELIPYLDNLFELTASMASWGMPNTVENIAIQYGTTGEGTEVFAPILNIGFENGSKPVEVKMGFTLEDNEVRLVNVNIGGD